MNAATRTRPVAIAAGEVGSAAIGQLRWPSDTIGITAPPMTRNVMPMLLAILTRSGADLTGSKPSRAQAEALCLARLTAFEYRRVLVGQAHTLSDDVIDDLTSICDRADLELLLVADPFGGAGWLSARSQRADLVAWEAADLHPVTVAEPNQNHEANENQFPVDVPSVDFHFFVDAVTHAFGPDEQSVVLLAFDHGARQGLAASVECDTDARVLLAEVWKEASSFSEALTLTRGVQAGLFHDGTLLKIDITALDEFISGGYARPVEAQHYDLLRHFPEPWKALSAAFFLAGHSPLDVANMTSMDLEQSPLDRAAEPFRDAYLRYGSLRPDDKSAVMPTDVRKIRGVLRALPHLGIPADVSASTLRAQSHGQPTSPGWHPRLTIRTRTLRSLT